MSEGVSASPLLSLSPPLIQSTPFIVGLCLSCPPASTPHNNIIRPAQKHQCSSPLPFSQQQHQQEPQTHRHTDTQTHRHRHTDTQTHRQTHRHRHRHTPKRFQRTFACRSCSSARCLADCPLPCHKQRKAQQPKVIHQEKEERGSNTNSYLTSSLMSGLLSCCFGE